MTAFLYQRSLIMRAIFQFEILSESNVRCIISPARPSRVSIKIMLSFAEKRFAGSNPLIYLSFRNKASAAHITGACPWKSPVLRFLA
jgi:hypothetical protein